MTVVLLVVVVALAQVECASIGKPGPVDNHVDVPDPSDTSNAQQREDQNIKSADNQVTTNNEDLDKPPDNSDSSVPSSDMVVANSHTITSEDFAAMTGVGGLQAQEDDLPEPPEISVSPTPGIPLHVDNTNAACSTHLETNLDDTNLVHDEKEADKISPGDSLDREKCPVSKSESDQNNLQTDEDVSEVSLDDLFQKISDEVKFYCNEVAMKWEEKKGGASWTLEAESVLKDYMDKILIAQSANNSNCVKKDLENHQDRSQSLKNVLDTCRNNIERKDWQKLQEETKNTLNQLIEIVQEYRMSAERLSKDDIDYYSNKVDLENKAKRKLQEVYSSDFKNKMSELKDNAIQGDVDEYIACIDNKPEKGMIVDTLNDIMRIKNNCVG